MRRRTTTTVLATACALTALGCVPVTPPAAIAPRDSICRGTYGAVTFEELEVPPGVTCTLQGTMVRGNIRVQRDATLDANGIQVIGNVQAEGARSVAVKDASRVGGSIQIKQGGAATVRATAVTGDIQLDANGAPLAVDANSVGGSIQIVGNWGGASITSNRVNGNLQCKENAPAPTGRGNVVQGNKEDQCAGL